MNRGGRGENTFWQGWMARASHHRPGCDWCARATMAAVVGAFPALGSTACSELGEGSREKISVAPAQG